MLIQSKLEIKFGIIREMTSLDNNMLNISWLCTIAGVSRSGYYRWFAAENARNAREEQDKKDLNLILEAYNYRGYAKGARGINMRLLHCKPSIVMNIKKIRRLMLKYGLKCSIRKANPYRRMMKAKLYPIKWTAQSLESYVVDTENIMYFQKCQHVSFLIQSIPT